MLEYKTIYQFKYPVLILSMILISYFCQGVFLTVLQPIFTGQDEARHYNSIQLIAESQDPIEREQATPVREEQDKDNLSTYRFSEEIRETARATDNHILRSDIYNTSRFSPISTGINEQLIYSRPWSTHNYADKNYLPDAVKSSILYHQLTSLIERYFSDESILVRFYLIRLFSVLLGTIAVFLAYLTARTIGFSSTISLIITAIIAFQPRFSIYLSQINYDALLIPLFFLFTYTGARAIRDGFTPTNLFFLTGTIVPALFTKATGYLLIPLTLLLFVPRAWQRLQHLEARRLRYVIITASFALFIGIFSFLYTHFFGAEASLFQKLSTLPTYLSKTISFGNVLWPSESYWGTIGWTESWFIRYSLIPIFIIELFASIGLGLLFFSKRIKSSSYPSFLPPKKQLLFLIAIVGILQLGVRFADWNTYVRIGDMSMSLGTPGRYFIPTLLAHILLISAGLGAFLSYFKKEAMFHFILTLFLIFIVSLNFHIIFNTILLRYYF